MTTDVSSGTRAADHPVYFIHRTVHLSIQKVPLCSSPLEHHQSYGLLQAISNELRRYLYRKQKNNPYNSFLLVLSNCQPCLEKFSLSETCHAKLVPMCTFAAILSSPCSCDNLATFAAYARHNAISSNSAPLHSDVVRPCSPTFSMLWRKGLSSIYLDFVLLETCPLHRVPRLVAQHFSRLSTTPQISKPQVSLNSSSPPFAFGRRSP